MIVFLLLVIVAILLFGSSAILGVIGRLLGILTALGAVVAGFFVLSDAIGKNPDAVILPFAMAVTVGSTGLWVILKLAGGAKRSQGVPAALSSSAPSTLKSEQPPIDRVWAWFAQDIEARFKEDARLRARELYLAGNAHHLDKFCRAELSRIGGARRHV